MKRWRWVSRQGFEPWTLGLKVRCSGQTELPAQRRYETRCVQAPEAPNVGHGLTARGRQREHASGQRARS